MGINISKVLNCKNFLKMPIIIGPHSLNTLQARVIGKDPGIVWSRDSTKINCPRGCGKVSNYMLENVTVNFKYQEWDFTIHSSKRPLTSILYFCLLLNYKRTVAFYQQSSQETNKSYTLKFEVGYSLSNIFSYQTGQSPTFVYFRFYLFLKYLLFANVDKLCADFNINSARLVY